MPSPAMPAGWVPGKPGMQGVDEHEAPLCIADAEQDRHRVDHLRQGVSGCRRLLVRVSPEQPPGTRRDGGRILIAAGQQDRDIAASRNSAEVAGEGGGIEARQAGKGDNQVGTHVAGTLQRLFGRGVRLQRCVGAECRAEAALRVVRIVDG